MKLDIQECGMCGQELRVENDFVNCAYCGKQLAEHDNWTIRGEPVHNECGIRAAVDALGHHEVIPALSAIHDGRYDQGHVDLVQGYVDEVSDLLLSLLRTIHER